MSLVSPKHERSESEEAADGAPELVKKMAQTGPCWLSQGVDILSQEERREPLKDFKQGKDTVNFVFLKYHSGSWIEREQLGQRQGQTQEDQSRGCGTSVKPRRQNGREGPREDGSRGREKKLS